MASHDPERLIGWRSRRPASSRAYNPPEREVNLDDIKSYLWMALQFAGVVALAVVTAFIKDWIIINFGSMNSWRKRNLIDKTERQLITFATRAPHNDLMIRVIHSGTLVIYSQIIVLAIIGFILATVQIENTTIDMFFFKTNVHLYFGYAMLFAGVFTHTVCCRKFTDDVQSQYAPINYLEKLRIRPLKLDPTFDTSSIVVVIERLKTERSERSKQVGLTFPQGRIPRMPKVDAKTDS